MVVVLSFTYPDSPVLLEQKDTRAILDKQDFGLGTAYISERSICWKGSNFGFSINFTDISLHGISNDPVTFERECIVIIIDAHIKLPGSLNEEQDANDSDSDTESESNLSELLFVPEDSAAVKSIYEAMKTCQALNPDPDDMDDEDEDIYEDADEEVIDPAAGGDNDISSLVAQLTNSIDIRYNQNNGNIYNDEIFEDAD